MSCNDRFGNLCRKEQIREKRTKSHYQIAILCYPVATHLTFEGVNCGSATQILEFVDFDGLGIVIHSDQVIASFPFEDISCYIDPRQVGCSRWYQRFGVITGQNSASRARCLHFLMPKCICACMLGRWEAQRLSCLYPLHRQIQRLRHVCPVHSYCVRCLLLCIWPTLYDYSTQLVQFICCAFLELLVSCHGDDRLNTRYYIWQVGMIQCISLPGLYVTFRSYGCSLSNIACLMSADSSGFAHIV